MLKDRASHTVADKQKRVLGGKVTDLADYKNLTGWIEGALFVLTLPERMQQELDLARTRNAEGGDAA